ncbi:MAG: HDOD domain-containing protein [Gallionella sp.]|nr:HDOD domain-containing protein [Gallionella sp.]
MTEQMQSLGQWVAFLSKAELPVLKQTARELTALREDDTHLSAHAVSQIIARDPMMTVKLLRYLQTHKRKAQTAEVVQVEQALLMIGLGTFFNHVPYQPLVEEALKSHLPALPPLLRVVSRSHRASEYAKEWAVELRDMHFEEVRIAALLHDIADILMWAFAPDAMLKIRAMQQEDKSLRSRAVQEQVLGFALRDLQQRLAEEWGLPELLMMLMDDANHSKLRVRNVVLAVNLARHSANGWNDAALPDDYRDIGELLRITAVEAMVRIVPDEADSVCDINKPH